MLVTGRVVASLRLGNGTGPIAGNSMPRVLTTYSDWQKAQADITFAETQLTRTKELAAALKPKKWSTKADQLRCGRNTRKDLTAAKASLLQIQIQGQTDVYAAETAVRAQAHEATTGRQLQQFGLEPDRCAPPPRIWTSCSPMFRKRV